MMRIGLLIALLVLNVLLAAALLGAFGDLASLLGTPREPERMTRQSRVETMQLVRPHRDGASAPAPSAAEAARP